MASVHAHSSSVTRATCFEQVDRPSLGDACDGREPEDVATADHGEHETELFDALEGTFCGPGRKKGERLHDCALRIQSNVRELAKQGVRLPDPVQGFLLLRRANLSTQARIAMMTLAGNSLSFGDVRKACKRHADELLRDPKDTTHAGHTRSLCHRQKEQVLRQRNRKETLTWKTPLRPWPRKATSIWKKPMFKRCCWLTKSYDRVTTVAWGTTGEPRLQTCDRAHQWRETLSS